MVLNLKKVANSIFGAPEEVDRIHGLPLTQLRLELKHAWQDEKFPQADFEAFIGKLAKTDDITTQLEVAKGAALNQQVDSELEIELNSPAKQLLWAAVVTRLMDERTAQKQGPVAQCTLWKQLQGTIGLHNEAITVSKMLDAAIQNDAVTFGWGQPGSWFYQDPVKNHLNFDLYFMLLQGFEHSRAVEGHEVGHSQLSTGYPPDMQALYEKVKDVIDPRTVDQPGAEPPKMTMKEQIDLAGDVAAWNLWHTAWNKMEDICVDQFSVNLRRTLQQDYGDSINNIAVVLRGCGEILNGDDLKQPVAVTTNLPTPAGRTPQDIFEQMLKEHMEEERKKIIEERIKAFTTPLTPQQIADVKAGNISPLIAEKMYNAIPTAAMMSGWSHNGLFSGTDKNWERLRIFADDIRQTVDVSKIPEAKGMDAFQYLVHLSAEAHDSIRLLQPEPKDRILLYGSHTNIEDSYKAVVAETTRRRGLVMQQIWDLYLKPFADVLNQEYKDQLKKRLDQQKKQQGGGKPDPNSKGQPQSGSGGQPDPNGQPQSGGQPDPNGQPQSGGQPDPNGQSQSGGQPDPNGQSKSGGKPDPNGQSQSGGGKDDKDQKSGAGGQGANDNADTPQELDKNLKEQIKNMAETPADKEGKDAKAGQENGKDGQGKDGQGKDGQGKDGQDKDGQGKEGQGKDGQGKDGQEGQGQGQGEGQGQSGQGTSGWGQDKNQQQSPIRVGDMKDKNVVKEDLTPEEKEAMKEAAKNMPKPDPNGMAGQAGNGRGVDLAKLAKGDWRDFNRRIMELAPVINRVAEAYKKIKKEQRRQILQQSKQLDYVPPDGDIQGRLDRDKMIETKFRKAAKQKMTLEDAKKFQDDHIATSECAIEMVAMIDGSGSMPMMNIGNGVTAMEAALQSAVINYMACRIAGIDAYIIMWGDAEPRIIATPDMPLKQVGENVESLRNGINSGTSLQPGIVSSVKMIAERRNKPGTISGSTHLLVYSDGDIQDSVATIKALEIVSANAKNLSVDVAVFRRPGSSASDTEMVRCFQTAIDKTGGKLVGVVEGNNPNEIPLELSRLMLKRVRSFRVKAEPDAEKRRRLKQLHKKLDGGP